MSLTREQHGLYFSADELDEALRSLGPTGTRAEATVAIAAQTLSALMRLDGEDSEFGETVRVGWLVEHYLSPEAARQASRPHVVFVEMRDEVDG